MPHIDYFFSTISPFTYLNGTRVEEIAQKHGATLTCPQKTDTPTARNTACKTWRGGQRWRAFHST